MEAVAEIDPEGVRFISMRLISVSESKDYDRLRNIWNTH